MWKRSPDRKAPARKTQKTISKPVKKVILDDEPQFHEDETENKYDDNVQVNELSKQMEDAILDQSIPIDETESISMQEETETYQEEIQKPSRRVQEEEYEESYTPRKEEEVPALRAPKPVRRTVQEEERPKTAARGKEEDANTLNKQAIIRLIKSSKVPSANSNVIDAIKEIIPTFAEKVLTEVCKDGEICTSDKVNAAISRYIKDEEKELNQEPFISAVQFDRLIRPMLNSHKISFKRDAFYYFHLFIESMMVKFLISADMIAEANRRQRIDAKDVSVAYMIFTM
jgi:histone H3/H4